jgi:hypothetical protein
MAADAKAIIKQEKNKSMVGSEDGFDKIEGRRRL